MGNEFFQRQVTADGYRFNQVSTSATGTNIPFSGVHHVALTTGAPAFSLTAPSAAGDTVTLYSITGSSGNKTATIIFATTGVFFSGSSGQTNLRKLTINAGNEAVHLIAHSSTRVLILTNTNAVAVAAT